MPINDLACRSAKPGQKPYRLFDGGGLYLEVAPSGGKWWRWKYRFAGKEKRLSLGTYPATGLKEARDACYEARKELRAGVDPSLRRKAGKAALLIQAENTFKAIAEEWFAKYSPNWAKGHSDKLIGRLKNDVYPWIGGCPIAEISAPQMLTVLRRIEVRGALETAHRAMQTCSRVPVQAQWPAVRRSRRRWFRRVRVCRICAPYCLHGGQQRDG